jgi:hypothetical protein
MNAGQAAKLGDHFDLIVCQRAPLPSDNACKLSPAIRSRKVASCG